VFSGQLTSAQDAEVLEWATLYWSRVDANGVPDIAAPAFVFSSDAMKSGLFNPLRAVRPTLEKVGSIEASLCDGLDDFGIAYPVEIQSQREAIRKAMLSREIDTSFASDPVGSSEHLTLVMDAPPDSDVTAWMDGQDLVSIMLPLQQVDAASDEGAVADNAGTQTQAVISDLVASGAAWAADAQNIGVPQWRGLITGETTIADAFAASVQMYLDGSNVQDALVDVLFANFGVYGELPVVSVTLSDAFVLMDPLNGNLVGPFQPGASFDAKLLLLAHPEAYSAGASIEYYNQFGCTGAVSATWYPSPPTCPACPAPGPVWVPVPPPAGSPPGTPPGRQTRWNCVDVTTPTGTACKCTSTRWVWIVPAPAQYPPGQPTIIRERLTCATPGFCGSITPPAPIGTAPCPWGAPTTDYWY
jgi:hypothetical protein